MLSRQTILEVHAAAVALQLDRQALLGAVPPSLARSIPVAASSASQLLADLDELNRTGPLLDGSFPLRVWLETAAALSHPRREVLIFQGALSSLTALPSLYTSATGNAVLSRTTQIIPPDRHSPPRTVLESVDKLEHLLLDREHTTVNVTLKAQLTEEIDRIVAELFKSRRLKPGDIVAGTELVKPIGTGNFGTIWLSKRIETGELMATKCFHIEKLTEGRMLWYFRRSCRAIARLKQDVTACKNVIQLHKVDPSTLAFSMEYLSEGNLEYIDTLGWTPSKKIDVMISLCRAVEYAHKIGIIHRDIKPANVVLNSKREPVLTDFDIADIRFLTKLSTAAGGLGTPVFAAPEQLEDASKADERSDVYSLGRMLYFFLLERPPPLQIEREPKLEGIASHPSSLVEAVRRATNFAPKRRFQSVGEFRQALEAYQTRLAIVRARMTYAWHWIRSNATVFALFVSFLVVATTVAIVQAWRASDKAVLAETERLARLRSEDLQGQLQETVSKLNQAHEDFDRLERQKSTLRAELSQASAELTVRQAACDRTAIGSSSRIACLRDVGLRKQSLVQLEEQQAQLNERIQEAKAHVESEVMRARTLAERQKKDCGCQAGDLMCAMKCSAGVKP